MVFVESSSNVQPEKMKKSYKLCTYTLKRVKLLKGRPKRKQIIMRYDVNMGSYDVSAGSELGNFDVFPMESHATSCLNTASSR